MRQIAPEWEYQVALYRMLSRVKRNYATPQHSCYRFACLDCSLCTFCIDEYYGLHKWLWVLINPEVKGMLCISCVEKRLGRELTIADFPYGNMNNDLMALTHSSPLLLNRRGQLKLLCDK